MASSKEKIVTGDEGGRVVILYPATPEPNFAAGGSKDKGWDDR